MISRDIQRANYLIMNKLSYSCILNGQDQFKKLMSNQSDFNAESFNEKIKILLDEDTEIKKWNEGILIKSLILFPLIIFMIGLYVVNRPENLTDILLVFIYPFALISIGLIILFVMRRKLK